MCDDDIQPGVINYDAAVSRRFFNVAALATAGMAGGSAAYAADSVVAKDVEVKTPDGVAEAALFYLRPRIIAFGSAGSRIFGLTASTTLRYERN